MIRIISEAMARRASPAIYVLALLCFLLPFASVSCNTDRAKPLLDAAIQSAGTAGGTADTTQVNACLDALRGRTFARYSGLNLVVGSDPSVSSDRVSACPGTPSSAATPSGRDENIGVQSLDTVALGMIVLALLFGMVPFPRRGLVVAILSGVAIVLLSLNENRLETMITDRAAASLQARAGSGNPLAAAFGNVSDFFSVTPGVGFWLAVVILGIAALYNSAATIIGDPAGPILVPPGPASLPSPGSPTPPLPSPQRGASTPQAARPLPRKSPPPAPGRPTEDG